jgi:hypothetical protein
MDPDLDPGGSKPWGSGGSGFGSVSARLVFHLSYPSFFLFFCQTIICPVVTSTLPYYPFERKIIELFSEPAVRDEFSKCEFAKRGRPPHGLFRVRCGGGLNPEAAAATRITSPRQPTLLPLLRGAEVLVWRVCVAGWWPDTSTRKINTLRLYFSSITVCTSHTEPLCYRTGAWIFYVTVTR